MISPLTIMNLSLTSGYVPDQFKSVQPLLKIPSLNPSVRNNFIP